MSAHTPGPWHVDRNWNILGPDGDDIHHLTTDARFAADRRLMAAAPDLLEALRACEDRLTVWQAGGSIGRIEDVLELVVRARAAITKATGGVP